MEKHPLFLRQLSPIEQAFTISNDAQPLSVVCVLHLSNGPEEGDLRAALQRLQERHPLLRAGIEKVNGRFCFQNLHPVPSLPLTIVERSGEGSWQVVTEQALNTTFDRTGPLMKCWYLSAAEEERGACEIIVSFHHAIVDGISTRLMLHELLSLAGGADLPLPLAHPVEPVFPPPFRKGKLARKMLSLAARQLREEWAFRKTGISAPIPPHSGNAVLSFRLSPGLSRQLAVRAGRAGLSLNTVLLAVMARVVYRHRHGDRRAGQARLISFADLRPFLYPPVSDQQMGCYVSMLRFGVPLSTDQSVEELAAQVRKALFKAGRRGETFLMAQASPYLIRMTLRLRNMRLGLAALSFIGKLDLEPRYGSIRLQDVKAFITNNRFGPEWSGFGKVLFGSIGLDFTYLTAEMNDDQARQLVKEIKETLEKMAEKA